MSSFRACTSPNQSSRTLIGYVIAAAVAAVSLAAPLNAYAAAGTCTTAGPAEVESSTGTAAGTPTAYASMGDAFTAINAGVLHTGVITIDICASMSEGATPATLNSSGAGSASYTSITIRPVDPGFTISGAPLPGFGVIQLNGADNVTINGDDPNSLGIHRDLTIENTAAATAVGNSAIRIAVSTTGVTSADTNTIKNLILNGNVTGGNSSLITSTTGSSAISFGIFAGGGGGATATDPPVALAAAGGTAAPTGTTINDLTIDNNAVNQAARAIVFNGAVATVSTGVTIINNTIGTAGTPTPATPPYTSPATTVYNRGIGISGTNALTVSGNTIQNIISYVGIGMSGVELTTAIGTGVIGVSGNTITNVVLNSATTTNFYARGVSVLSTAGTYTVGGNTITNIQNFSSSSANQAGGIFVNTAATSATIELNKITTVNNRSTGTFGSHGISLSGGSNVTVKNNFVADVTQNMTGGAAFSGTFGVFGLRIASGTGHKVYHNSINLTGALAGTASGGNLTAALGISVTGLTGIDVRNNIFANTMTGGSGTSAHVSVFLPASGTTANMNLTENNNAYYSGSVAGFSGIAHVGTAYTAVPVGSPSYAGLYTAANFVPGSSAGTLNFRFYTNTLSAAATNDNASFASIAAAPFTSATDLHVNTGLANTALESGGAAVGVASDIDGQVRPGPAGSVNGGATAPDLGADEFDGVPLLANDLAATAFIDPASGGTKGAGISFSPQASFTNAGTATQTGVTVRYRIIDSSPAEVYNQTAVIASIGPNAVATITFPSTSLPVGSYVIKAAAELAGDSAPGNDEITGTLTVETPLAGSYDVGTGGAYTSLTNPGGVFEKLNTAGASGNVVLNITSDLAGELGTHALNEVAGGFTVTIKPSGGPRQIVGSNIGALIRLNGADGVTIDGSTTGATLAGVGGNPAIRELTIQNTNTGTGAVVISVGSGPNGAQNNTIRNVNVLGQDPTTTLLGISLGGTAPGTVGTDNDNNHVENCSVRRAIFGIYSAGLSSANPNVGTVITMNETSAVTGDRIRRVAIIVFNEDGIQITENAVNGVSTNESADGIGIAVGNQAMDTTTVTSGGITNALVSRNRINGVASVSATGFSAAGITIAGAAGGANTIVNNMITGVTAPATSPDLVAGIYVIGAAGASTRIYDNSVAMTGDRGAVASQLPSFGIAATGTNPVLELKSNIFYTTQIASGGGVNAKSYAIGLVTTTFGNLDSDFNAFWSTGANDGGFRTGSLGAAAGTDYATIALWRTAVSDDAASVEADPIFVAPASDLHLDLSGPGSAVENAGVFLASVPTDIDGDLRNPAGPDIGADELRCHTGVDSCDDGNACSVDSCIPATGCAYTAGNLGAICRPAAGGCDVAETCDGTSIACPDDDFEAPGIECRAPAGICDVAESCTGSSAACPTDEFEPSTTECRASTAQCDPAELCTGSSATCPPDAVNQSAPVGSTVALSHDKPSATTTITWTEVIPGPFDVYRGSITTGLTFAYNQSCFADGTAGPSVTDTTTPPAGQAFYYLISREQSPCSESNLGQDGSGADRPNVAPCPLPATDGDADGFVDAADNCPLNFNPAQADLDGDLHGDVCDNCPTVWNPDQNDANGDLIGDACD